MQSDCDGARGSSSACAGSPVPSAELWLVRQICSRNRVGAARHQRQGAAELAQQPWARTGWRTSMTVRSGLSDLVIFLSIALSHRAALHGCRAELYPHLANISQSWHLRSARQCDEAHICSRRLKCSR